MKSRIEHRNLNIYSSAPKIFYVEIGTYLIKGKLKTVCNHYSENSIKDLQKAKKIIDLIIEKKSNAKKTNRK